MQIFVNSVERLNSPVYSTPPCRVTTTTLQGLPTSSSNSELSPNCFHSEPKDSISAELIYEIRHACDGLEL